MEPFGAVLRFADNNHFLLFKLVYAVHSAARKVAGNGFYYLMGDIARLHSAVISYARDFTASMATASSTSCSL